MTQTAGFLLNKWVTGRETRKPPPSQQPENCNVVPSWLWPTATSSTIGGLSTSSCANSTQLRPLCWPVMMIRVVPHVPMPWYDSAVGRCMADSLGWPDPTLYIRGSWQETPQFLCWNLPAISKFASLVVHFGREMEINTRKGFPNLNVELEHHLGLTWLNVLSLNMKPRCDMAFNRIWSQIPSGCSTALDRSQPQQFLPCPIIAV